MNNREKKEKLSNLKSSLESTKLQIISIVKKVLEEKYPSKISELMKSFTFQYDFHIKKYETDDNSNLLRYYRIISQFKPALATVIETGKEFDDLCTLIEKKFDNTLNKAQSQKSKKTAKKKSTMELKYFCTICNQNFDIPVEKKKEIEDSDEKIILPKHHDKEMILKIIHNGHKENIVASQKFSLNQHYRSNKDKDHNINTNQDINSLQVLSVGIDVGSSTSHLIFSRLTLKREFSFTNKTNRFQLVKREIIYEGEIIFTPLLDSNTIDIEKIVDFFKKEYKKAKITSKMVDTGAVIVTGETAKKDNAAEIVKRLSSESGKFVSASAGPNFESMLGIMGSGMVDESKRIKQTIMNVDIGGGTSNIAIASNGIILSTSCINVGGRLLGITNDFKIWRIDEPTKRIMNELGLNYNIGDYIIEEDVHKIVIAYVNALLEVMQGPAVNPIAKMLMMTDDIELMETVDKLSFSGGVAELIYKNNNNQDEENHPVNLNPYNDIGQYLALEIRKRLKELQIPVIEPKNKIRATVIGAGAFSLSVSGSTCYCDESIVFPLSNLPIIPIDIDYNKFFFDGYQDYMKQKVNLALQNFNLVEGEDEFAIYFKDPIYQSAIVPFAKSIETAFTNSIINNKMILIILGEDGGKMLGLTIKRETIIQNNLFCLDELDLEAGDWVDIGAPLNTGEKKTFPITKKSLVFDNK